MVVLVCSCSNQEMSDISQTSEVSHYMSIRSYDEALKIAQASISIIDNNTLTRSADGGRNIDFSEKKVFTSDVRTRSSNNVNDTLIYVFNFENDKGFALVSASKNTEGLLAVTEKGHCNPETRTEIEGYEMFVDLAKTYVLNSLTTIGDSTKFYIETEYEHSYVGPYVPVRWGQQYPEGEYCPNGICGCSITAMAQVMAYYQYPTYMTITYPNADVTTQTFSWLPIHMHSTGHNMANCTPNKLEYHKSISRLCRQLGYIANSNYNPTSTSTKTDSLKYTMLYYGFNATGWNDYFSQDAQDNLDDGKVIIMRGTREGNHGHAWILDGYDDITAWDYVYFRTPGTNSYVLRDILGPYNYRLNHLNWGWYGTNNGYFSANVFDTALVQFPDTPNNSVSRNYYINLKTLFIDLE